MDLQQRLQSTRTRSGRIITPLYKPGTEFCKWGLKHLCQVSALLASPVEGILQSVRQSLSGCGTFWKQRQQRIQLSQGNAQVICVSKRPYLVARAPSNLHFPNPKNQILKARPIPKQETPNLNDSDIHCYPTFLHVIFIVTLHFYM